MTTAGFATPSDRVLVLFGATGDLAARKLLPGLFHLYRVGLMPESSGSSAPGATPPEDFVGHVEQALRNARPDGARRPLGGVLQAAGLRRLQSAEDGTRAGRRGEGRRAGDRRHR